MTRAALIVMDSFGIGAADDADAFGDAGADTLGHIAAACAAGSCDVPGVRQGPLNLPTLDALGLGWAARSAAGRLPEGFSERMMPGAAAGFAAEVSPGKDTPSGHWEIAGLPVPFTWGYFPQTVPAFPSELTAAILKEAGLPGALGLRHASGTAIIDELGGQSVTSGMPIFYTSADSVLQIAAHEGAFGLDRLYALCRIARRHVDDLNIGRVIARPFTGDVSAGFRRTANRRDYAVPPPGETLLDLAERNGRAIVTIGKIGDIFAHRSVGRNLKGADNDALFDAMLAAWTELPEGGLLFANFVDFDTFYGHRRDVAGYAACLEAFDRRLPQMLAKLQPEDLLIITADHGCDPTWQGSDHTREFVPVLMLGGRAGTTDLGRRESFADIGASVAAHLGLPASLAGRSFC